MISRARGVFSCLVLLLAALCGQGFSATTVAVGTCTALTHQYATIQAAVNASLAGTIIDICPGTYPEQVSINKKLTLTGIANGTADGVIIAPPAGGMMANTTDIDSANPIAAQVWIHATKGPVAISNVTVDGTGNGITDCTDLQGVLFQNAAGTLVHVAVRNQTLGAGLTGCQSGEGIYVQTAPTFTSVVTVVDSSVHNYQKNGITGNDAGTKLVLTGNFIQGSGVVAPPNAAQNGIQLGYGATGSIVSQTVIDNIYGDPTAYDSADILLVDTLENSGIKITSNVVGNSQLPIVLFTDFAYGSTQYGDGVSIVGNHIFGASTFDAIDVCTNGNTVTGNTIFNSAESGVHLDASCGTIFSGPPTGNSNNASSNTIVESLCAGILADAGTTGNTTNSETYYTMPFTLASSTASCPTLMGPLRAKATHNFSPKR